MQTPHNDDNLRQAYQGLRGAAHNDGRGDQRGAVYSFISPFAGSGTSWITRRMAIIAAQTDQGASRPVLIVDMDLQNNAQSAQFTSQLGQQTYGEVDGPYDAAFGADPFWRVTPSVVNADGQSITDNHYASLHMVPSINVGFTTFHWDKLRDGQNVHVQNARAYWHALRDRYSAIFVDTPSLDRSNILSAIAPEADTNVIVAPSHLSNDRALNDCARSVTELGGSCAGVILNDGPARAPLNEGRA